MTDALKALTLLFSQGVFYFHYIPEEIKGQPMVSTAPHPFHNTPLCYPCYYTYLNIILYTYISIIYYIDLSISLNTYLLKTYSDLYSRTTEGSFPCLQDHHLVRK